MQNCVLRWWFMVMLVVLLACFAPIEANQPLEQRCTCVRNDTWLRQFISPGFGVIQLESESTDHPSRPDSKEPYIVVSQGGKWTTKRALQPPVNNKYECDPLSLLIKPNSGELYALKQWYGGMYFGSNWDNNQPFFYETETESDANILLKITEIPLLRGLFVQVSNAKGKRCLAVIGGNLKITHCRNARGKPVHGTLFMVHVASGFPLCSDPTFL